MHSNRLLVLLLLMKAQRVSTTAVEGTSNTAILDTHTTPSSHYYHPALSFYCTPPTPGDISICELDSICKARLALLQSIDKKFNNTTNDNGGGETSIDTQGSLFCEAEATNVVMSIPTCLIKHAGRSSSSDYDNDIISHYMLRLAFCRSPELSSWFIKCEELLLQCILHHYGHAALNKALQQTGVSNLINRIVTDTDVCPPDFYSHDTSGNTGKKLIDILRKATSTTTTSSLSSTTFYEIPFIYCSSELIAKRAVVIIGGMAYIPDTQLGTLLCKTYREQLRRHLAIALQERTVFMNDPRIASIVKHMHPTYRPSNGNNMDNIPDSEKLSLDNFNLLLERSFPPCMRSLIEHMRHKKTHLKHRGRQQLPPFLRSAGLNMDDSLRWFKTEFTRDQSIDPDKFDRHYSYDIKWVYGKVGRMKPAQALSCSTIIGFEYPTGDQIHGCPFKNMDEHVLRKTLSNWAETGGFQQQQTAIMIDDITKKSKREAQLACQEWFRIMHPGSSGDGVGNHPNSYFSESIAYHLEKDGKSNNADTDDDHDRMDE